MAKTLGNAYNLMCRPDLPKNGETWRYLRTTSAGDLAFDSLESPKARWKYPSVSGKHYLTLAEPALDDKTTFTIANAWRDAKWGGWWTPTGAERPALGTVQEAVESWGMNITFVPQPTVAENSLLEDVVFTAFNFYGSGNGLLVWIVGSVLYLLVLLLVCSWVRPAPAGAKKLDLGSQSPAGFGAREGLLPPEHSRGGARPAPGGALPGATLADRVPNGGSWGAQETQFVYGGDQQGATAGAMTQQGAMATQFAGGEGTILVGGAEGRQAGGGVEGTILPGMGGVVDENTILPGGGREMNTQV